MNENSAKPIHLTDAQIADLSSGKADAFDELSRPRFLSEQDIEAFSKGYGKDFEKIAILPPDSSALDVVRERHLRPTLTPGPAAIEGGAIRPRTLTDKDIAELRAGKSGEFERREMLKPQ